MSLSSEQQATIIESTVESIMKQYVLPHIGREVRENIREVVFDCLKYLYADEIREQVKQIVTAGFLNKLDIQVTMKE
jgi:hypothetical protein